MWPHACTREASSSLIYSPLIRKWIGWEPREGTDHGRQIRRKSAVITGGSTGIGLATAKRFVQEGMDHVFITGRRKDALDRAVAEIGKA